MIKKSINFEQKYKQKLIKKLIIPLLLIWKKQLCLKYMCAVLRKLKKKPLKAFLETFCNMLSLPWLFY